MKKESMVHKGRVALVTGGASFLGAAISRKLAAEGFQLILHYQNSFGKTKKIADELKSLGSKVMMFRADLRKVEQAPALIRSTIQAFKRLDLLINNASLFTKTPISITRPEQWRELFDVNLFSPFFLSRAAKPWLQKAHGCIVNMTDIYAEKPILRDHSGYSASKAALVNLTQSLAREMGPGVRVNAVSPGAIFIPENYDRKKREALIGRSALKRKGTPEDIAEAVYFLATQRFITGQTLKVDGGRFLQ
jgi:pteridine reductase